MRSRLTQRQNLLEGSKQQNFAVYYYSMVGLKVKCLSYPSLLTFGFVPITQTQQDLLWKSCLIAGISHCSAKGACEVLPTP